jgi:hypothetical protein
MFDFRFYKIKVNGPTAHPLYNFLKSNFDDESEIGWNFVKWLLINGRPIARYASRIKPRQIEADILKYLYSDGSEL